AHTSAGAAAHPGVTDTRALGRGADRRSHRRPNASALADAADVPLGQPARQLYLRTRNCGAVRSRGSIRGAERPGADRGVARLGTLWSGFARRGATQSLWYRRGAVTVPS